MSKKQQKQPAPATKQTEKTTAPAQAEAVVPVTKAPPFNYGDIRAWFTEFTGQAIIVALLAFALYCNTFQHEFAHDDGIVIVKNEYVLEGFAGISSIMTKDAYDSYYRQLNTTNQLEGGRYRPLSIVTFALEQQFLGAVKPENVDSVLKQTISYGVSGPSQKKLVSNMHVRHVFNVLWYMLSVVVLLYFLRYVIFGKYPVVAFIAVLLFTVHPIHTEVVANVKSRDEIMSLLFMSLTFIYAFKYEENKQKWWQLLVGMVSFYFAFLSKEYAITMIALLPMAFYIFRGYSFFKSITTVFPYAIVFAAYLVTRLNAVAPFEGDTQVYTLLLLVTGSLGVYFYIKPQTGQKSDSTIFIRNLVYFLPYFLVAVYYLKLRVDAIPPVTESAAKEVLNNPYLFAEGSQKLATEISSSMYYLKLLVFPHPLSADYSYNQIPYKDFSHPLVWLSLVVHLGMIALMFVFLPKRKLEANASVNNKTELDGKGLISFAIAFYLIHLLLVCNVVFDIGATLGERLIYHSSVGFAIVVAWLLYKGAERMNTDAAWKGLAGLMIVVVGLMGFKTIDRNQYWKNDSTLFGEDIKTVPNSVLVNANVAASYITLADYAETKERKQKYLKDAIVILDHTLSIHRKFVAAFLNRGIAWYKLDEIDKARANIDTVKSLYPTYPTLPGMYKLICDFYLKKGWEEHGKLGDYVGAIEIYKKGLQADSSNLDLWYNMGGAYFTNKQFPEAVSSFQMALRIDPNNQMAKAGLNAAVSQLNQVQGPPGKK